MLLTDKICTASLEILKEFKSFCNQFKALKHGSETRFCINSYCNINKHEINNRQIKCLMQCVTKTK